MESDNLIYYVYLHTNKINGKKYVGVSMKSNPNSRWKNGKGYNYNAHFSSAIQKYGWDNFSHEILETNLSKDGASKLEQEYIDKFNTTDENFGYNLAEGGYNNRGLKGRLNPFWNKRPDKAIEASVAVRKGKPLSDETKEKIRQGNIKAPKNINSINALAVGRNKKKPWFTGSKNPKSTAVYCVELDIVYESQRQAEQALNLPRGSVYQSIKCKIKAKDYHFERVLNSNDQSKDVGSSESKRRDA